MNFAEFKAVVSEANVLHGFNITDNLLLKLFAEIDVH